MAKKQFVFNAQTPASSNEDRPNIDFDKMNQYIVETVGCSEKPEALIGIVSGVIDLGLQAQEDAKMKWSGTPADEAAEIAKNPLQYFEDIKDTKTNVTERFKRWPVKAQRSVALTIDFPDTLVNRGQFFDEEGGGEELPFRGLLNNEFGLKGVGKVVGKAYSLKENRNDDGTWSLKNNTILWKLAQATGQLNTTQGFKPADLGNLIGEAAMFNVQVFLNEHGGKHYLNEKLAFNGPVPKAMQKLIPDLDEKFQYVVNFKGEQDLEVLKTLRQSIINTMKQAEDFEGSDVQKALIAVGKIKEGEQQTQSESPVQTQQSKPQAAQKPAADFDDFDSDIPF